MKKIRLRLDKKRSYDIIIGEGVISRLGEFIKRLGLGSDAVIITNPVVYAIHKNALKKAFVPGRFNVTSLTIPDAETSKSNREVVRLIESLVKADKARPFFIAAFGGGVVGDVAGFVASIYKRGVPYIQIPTTLLAQADSAIGGKVAIDLKVAKNMVGAFYQPRLVISDTSFLRTLTPRQIRSGLGEVIKYGAIEDVKLFSFLENNIQKILKLDRRCLEHIVYRSSRIKARITQKDEYDKKGIRAKLNYGHTIGHAIEAASGYSKAYSHGEAVGIGMIAAAEISCKMGILKRPHLLRLSELIKKAGLPVKISERLKIEKIMEAQSRDKKILRGVNRFVLPVRIGDVRIYEGVPKRLIEDCLKSMQQKGR